MPSDPLRQAKQYIDEIALALEVNQTSPVVLHEPDFSRTQALNYVQDCIQTGWVSSAGAWVSKFEKQICKLTGATHAIAVVNGTSGIRLALHIVGVSSADEVLLPSITFVATANAVSHLGAQPHFVDIEEATLGICPDKLHAYLREIITIKDGVAFNKSTNKRIAALVPVHIFGRPCRIHDIVEIASLYRIPVIEDAAEALGSYSSGMHCGLIGDIGVLSFNGNKIITTGGGGCVVTNNRQYADSARHLSTTAKVPHKWNYLHDSVAWNDRMPNINAALGIAQLEVFENILSQKKKLHSFYTEKSSNYDMINILDDSPTDSSNHWLISAHISTDKSSKWNIDLMDEFMGYAHSRGLNLRPLWLPIHSLPMYRNSPKSSMHITDTVAHRIFSLPSSAHLSSRINN